jgi:hypothetical protein
MILQSTKESFDCVDLLFQHFVVTAGGWMLATQQELNNYIKIQSSGLTLMDGVEQFCWDLAQNPGSELRQSGVVGEVN